MKRVAVVEGDDASPEAMRPAVALMQDLQLDIEWVYPEVGDPAIQKYGHPLPEASKQIIDDADCTFFGSTSTTSAAALFYLRWGKQTFANVRPCRYIPGCASPLRAPEGIDFVIVRENLEDLYLRVEGDLEELAPLNLLSRTQQKHLHELAPGRFAIKAITEEGSARVLRFSFELAQRRAQENQTQPKLSSVQKHNMLPQSDGLFMEIAQEMAKEYPDVAFETLIVDDAACRLVAQPQRFDVMVMPNLYGDILSDAAAGLVGSLGLAASGCYGNDYAYFESAHGTAPDIAGQGVINPTATLLSAVMMLRHLGYQDAAQRLDQAITSTYAEGSVLTPDQGGTSGTEDFMRALRRYL